MSVITRTNAKTRPTPPGVPEPPELAPPPKLRRRPVALVVSVATVVVGSLLGLWLWTVAGNTSEVLAVRTLVHRGEVIDRDDLMVVRVSLDPAVKTVPANQEDVVAGQRAALDLAPGGLLTPDDLTATVVPARGTSVVGIGLAPGMLPAEPIAPGDAVRVVQTPGQQGEVAGTPVTSRLHGGAGSSSLPMPFKDHHTDTIPPGNESRRGTRGLTRRRRSGALRS